MKVVQYTDDCVPISPDKVSHFAILDLSETNNNVNKYFKTRTQK